ncbi:MAG TPA: hypothetical protein VMM78_09280 [Thermomicrobiales bacterium]|nr:hypothetical protein [Thermomicrobiales bacterium]
MENPFSWDYLTAPIRETSTFGPLSVVYLVLFGVTFLGCAFVFIDAQRRFADHKLRRDMFRSGANVLMWITGVGLFFFAVRYMRFELLTFERRIWMYLTFLVYTTVVSYFVYYLRAIYPQRLAAFERQRAKRKYISPSVGNAARSGRSSRGDAPRRKRVAR